MSAAAKAEPASAVFISEMIDEDVRGEEELLVAEPVSAVAEPEPASAVVAAEVTDEAVLGEEKRLSLGPHRRWSKRNLRPISLRRK